MKNSLEADRVLLTAIKRGDERAFRKIFDKYHKRLYLFIYKVLHSKVDAEEITQEVFIRIWEHKHLLKKELSFSGYLFKVAKNLLYDQTKKRLRRELMDNDLIENMEAWSTNETEREIFFKDTKSMVEMVVDGLPEKRKQIFLMSREEGLDRNQIAESLGLSVYTVDSQLTKAVKYVKAELLKKEYLLVLVLLKLLQ